jgi:hypothetical protein
MATKKNTKRAGRKPNPQAAPDNDGPSGSTGSGPAVTTLVAPPPVSREGELTITISGTERAVRRALTTMRFDQEPEPIREPVGEPTEWNPTVTRRIAREKTLTADAALDDELAGPKLRMFAQDDRDLYRDRCVNEAAERGHPVSKPSKIPAKEKTTVMEVGDALFDNAAP